ncbi:MAG: phosphoglycerate kinase, partial [Anaerolineae bacterium]
MEVGILTLDDLEFRDKLVILRLDINSPIEPRTGELADDNRIRKSVPTVRELGDAGARVVMLAHQGDT